MDLGSRDMRVRVHERVQFGLLCQIVQQGDGVDAGDGERMRADIADPLTSSINFEVPTDNALSILVTGLDEHAQPPWPISPKATLSASSPHAPSP
jgi:hypothetical protein